MPKLLEFLYLADKTLSDWTQKRAPWFRHKSRCSFHRKIFFLSFLTAYQVKKDSRINSIIRIIAFISSSNPQFRGYATI